MPTPVNNGQPGVLNLDYKVVAAGILSVKKNSVDLTADASAEFVADINRQNTSTQIVRLEPTVELAAVPADRTGSLDYTSVIGGGTVEVTLTNDEYAKIPVDRLGVKPAEAATTVGTAIGKALVKAENANFTATLAAGGQAINLAVKFADLTGQDVWSALNESNTQFAEGEIDTTGLVTYIAPRPWGKVQDDIATLRSAQNPQEQAKTLLQVGTVRIVNLPEDVVAIQFHPAAAACPSVLDRLRTIPGDADDAVYCRVKYGAKVLLSGAVRVIKAAPAA